MRALVLMLMLGLSTASFAKDEVYKWVDDKGVIHYTDKPPTDGAKPTKLPPLQTYKGGTVPPLNKFEKSTIKGTGNAAQILVVTPSRDETFRGGERVVPVAVQVTPQLAEGQKLVYLLDGTPASPPTTDTAFALTEVDRGSHVVSVSLVDASGEVIANSSGVQFHMKPPIADQGGPDSSPPSNTNQPKPKPTPPKPKPKPP